MTIVINGEPRQVNAGTLQALVEELQLDNAAVATARNGEFVFKTQRATTRLVEGDRIEIVAPMQGG